MRFLLPSREQPDRGMTDLQIEEAKRLVAEVVAVKDELVAKANGALVKLKHGGVLDVKGESES